MARRYTTEQIEFLRERRLTQLPALTVEFNAHFGTQKALASIQSFFGNHGIQRVRLSPGKGNGTATIYTPERVAWLCVNYPLLKIPELTAAFNARFGTSIGKDALHSALGRDGIQSGRDGRFEQGLQTWNKGKKGYMGANRTSFKKGAIPPNRKPLWTERIDPKYGFIVMKVPERNPYTGHPTRYKHKHVWIWEEANGPVPKGHCVAFRDSDMLNCSPENLMLITRAELLMLNLHNYAAAPPELKPSLLALAKLETKAGFRTVRAAGAGRKRKEH